jgi:hypothetical protein
MARLAHLPAVTSRSLVVHSKPHANPQAAALQSLGGSLERERAPWPLSGRQARPWRGCRVRGSFPRLFKPAQPAQTAISPARPFFNLGVTVHKPCLRHAALTARGARRAFSAGKVALQARFAMRSGQKWEPWEPKSQKREPAILIEINSLRLRFPGSHSKIEGHTKHGTQCRAA